MNNHQYTIAITLTTDNAVFDEQPEVEIRRILADAIEKAADHMSKSDVILLAGERLLDSYGNTVGTLSMTGAPTN